MSIVNSNIRFLRKKKGITQEELAKHLGVTRSVIGAYEEGRAEPRIQTMQKIANFFDISLDQLINTEFEKGSHSAFLKSAGSPASALSPGSKLRILSISVDSQGNENIELVPQKAAAGYLNGYADPEFISELPKFRLPNLPAGTYRAFELSGESMLPLKPGTIVIGKFVEGWKDIKDGKTYVLVTQSEGVVYKRVTNHIHLDQMITLSSDNPVFEPFKISASEVMEAWRAVAYISTDFPEGDISLQKLANIVMDLQQEVIRLKKE